MSAIGGFFGLEQTRECRPAWHRDALALTSGRACLRAILELMRPRRVLVPFFICDAAIEPIRRLDIPIEFYPLTPSLDPDVKSWPLDAAVLYVNYFDLKGGEADDFAEVLGARGIVDDTQAFFRRGHAHSFAFNSARKFFGVPDGAYVYGPEIHTVTPGMPNVDVSMEHLTTRIRGSQGLAYQQYVAAEQRVSGDVLAASARSRQLLSGVDYDDVRQSRRRNFLILHDRLSMKNTLRMEWSLDDEAAPFCYPFVPVQASLHEQLWRREILVPRLWPEVPTRAADGFAWERDLALRLLPLPVDHRYNADDMNRVADAVLELAA